MKLRLKIVAMLALFGAPAFAEDITPDVETGANTYKQYCSHCHGLNMVNAGTTTYDPRKYPTDDPTGFFASVRDGKGDMPAWGDILCPEEIHAIWVYVATRAGQQSFSQEAQVPPEVLNPEPTGETDENAG